MEEDQVERADGKKGIFGTVTMKAGVSILPVDAEGNVYLVREYRYALGRYGLEVVSGGVDESEEPLAAAKRELLEELGITADDWTPLGVVHPFTNIVDAPVYLFLARGLSFQKSSLEEGEEIVLQKMPFLQALAKVKEEIITHAPSCVLLLKAKEVLDGR